MKARHLILILAFFVTAISAHAEDLTLKFINHSGEAHKGCAFMAWDKSGKKVMDGVHPVGGNETVVFKLPNWQNYTHWQFIAAIDYSDDPNDLRVVMMNTGKRKVEKASYSVEVGPPTPKK
jgi:hypothetical protein